nr:acyltransferase [Propionibacterium sp.]
MDAATRARNASLDGLRGVAALAVLWSHLVVHLGLMPIPPLGGMGVLVFFVLSGYLIARIVAKRAAEPGAYRAFLRRRFVRLAPAITVLSVAGALILILTHAAEPRWAAQQGLLALTQTTAFASGAGVAVHPVLAPTWSLTVEWVFYLLFPAVLLALVRRGRRLLTVARDSALVAAGLYASGLLLDPMAFYHLPVANLAVMLLGAALGLAHHSGWSGPDRFRTGPWPWAGAAVIAIFIFLPGYPLGWGYKLSVLPATALAAALVINGAVSGHPVGRVLATKSLVAVGVRAYSLYLWHMSVLWLTWLGTGSGSWWTAALACALLVPVVELSYRLLEVPVLRAGSNALQPQTAPA